MPSVRKIDAVEAGWGDLLSRVGSRGLDCEYLRGKAYYWSLIQMLDYPPDAWIDPVWRTSGVAWLGAHMPEFVQRLAVASNKKRFLYRLTSEGRDLAKRFAAYESSRD